MLSKRCWVTLLSHPGDNNGYLKGILTLNYTLKKVKTQYPLLVIYTNKCPANILAILEKSGIKTKYIDTLQLVVHWNYGTDTKKFNDCFNKLRAFSLFEYERVVLIDSDMIFMKNADELFDVHLERGFIASAYACLCNPKKIAHYPKDWVPSNCPYTSIQQNMLSDVSISCMYGIKMLNSGLVVLEPNPKEFELIVEYVVNYEKYSSDIYSFAEQSLLSYIYQGKWVVLPYIYNALKTLRTLHEKMWNDDDVKIVHYILNKPWNDKNEGLDSDDLTHTWWWSLQKERKRLEENSIIYE